MDLAFASIDSKLFACVDGEGSLFVFEITEDASNIKYPFHDCKFYRVDEIFY